jgi:periplasmic divalent cation tolerance protein
MEIPGVYAVVFMTVSSPEEGSRIAEALVAEKLAACVNRIDGISSVFWWQERVERATESLLIAKTQWNLIDQLIARVREMHSYTVPEVIALPIERGNPDYLKWIADVTG